MELIPMRTGIIHSGDDLAGILTDVSAPQNEDIFVISSKAVATSEGRIVDLSALKPSDDAKKLAKKCGRTPEFCQAVLEEVAKRNGEVVGTCPGAVVTELRPHDRSSEIEDRSSKSELRTTNSDTSCTHNHNSPCGTIITANAGLDESNAKEGTAIGWPEDPVESAAHLKRQLEEQISKNSQTFKPSNLQTPTVAVIISDSCLRPRRWGVTAFALAASGIDPLSDKAGTKDLFGKPLHITKEATADQLATAANMLMGNADQSIPAVIIRNHGLALSDFEGWVPGVEPEEDLFKNIL